MFDPSSRYAKAETYAVPTRDGRSIVVVAPPAPPTTPERGIHRRHGQERLDHLAWRYLRYPTGFWRIAEANDVMIPDQLRHRRDIRIPGGGRP
jgi:hypothetical protein